MFIRIKMQCPYCKHNNTVRVEINSRTSQNESSVITCDNDDGGCDKDFVMYSTMNITAYVKPIGDTDEH